MDVPNGGRLGGQTIRPAAQSKPLCTTRSRLIRALLIIQRSDAESVRGAEGVSVTRAGRSSGTGGGEGGVSSTVEKRSSWGGDATGAIGATGKSTTCIDIQNWTSAPFAADGGADGGAGGVRREHKTKNGVEEEDCGDGVATTCSAGEGGGRPRGDLERLTMGSVEPRAGLPGIVDAVAEEQAGEGGWATSAIS